MSGDRALPPVSVRRAQAQRRVALQRTEIAAAWSDFERHEVNGEHRVRQAVALTRRVAGISALLAAGLALRRASSGRPFIGPRKRRLWRGLVRPLFWLGVIRRAMRRKRDGPGGEGQQR